MIVVLLIFVPDHHASFDFVFTDTHQQLGLQPRSMFWFYVLPLGFLLTQYTITGFDASAHISEETHGAAEAARRRASGGRSSTRRSIGWILLLAITFAATDADAVNEARRHASLAVFESAMSTRLGQARS